MQDQHYPDSLPGIHVMTIKAARWAPIKNQERQNWVRDLIIIIQFLIYVGHMSEQLLLEALNKEAWQAFTKFCPPAWKVLRVSVCCNYITYVYSQVQVQAPVTNHLHDDVTTL